MNLKGRSFLTLLDFTPEEIEKGDARPGKRRDGEKSGAAASPRGDDSERLMEKLVKNKEKSIKSKVV